jgi:hypothetical protein
MYSLRMAGDYKLPEMMRAAAGQARARIRFGYPWWLRPFLAKGVIAITLGRRIYLSPVIGQRSEQDLERLLRHELAHVRQVNRHGLIRFLRLYVTEFLRHFRRERSVQRAYRAISFEIEAEAAEEGQAL